MAYFDGFYFSEREHAEHVDETMYRVPAGYWFTAVRGLRASPNCMPGTLGAVFLMAPTKDELRDRLREFLLKPYNGTARDLNVATQWEPQSTREHVKLEGGQADGEILEVDKTVVEIDVQVSDGKQMYRRTQARNGFITGFPIFVPK